MNRAPTLRDTTAPPGMKPSRAPTATVAIRIQLVLPTWGMKKPELTDMGWLGPKDEMDRASHRFGKCSNCDEIIRNCTYGGRHSFPISPDPTRRPPRSFVPFCEKT